MSPIGPGPCRESSGRAIPVVIFNYERKISKKLMNRKLKRQIIQVACLLLVYGAYRLLSTPARPPMAGQSTLSGSRRVTVAVLDVGQGDAILIRSPEGKTALVDAGPSREVVRELRQMGVTSLDMVVVSHHHADHYGGMAEVIRAYPPRLFMAAGSSH